MSLPFQSALVPALPCSYNPSDPSNERQLWEGAARRCWGRGPPISCDPRERGLRVGAWRGDGKGAGLPWCCCHREETASEGHPGRGGGIEKGEGGNVNIIIVAILKFKEFRW